MKKTEIELLVEKIKEHNNAYRAGIPIVSDQEYDQEIEKLKQLDPTNNWLLHIEPAPVGEARKVKLPIPMKSLNKVKDMKSLTAWIKSIGLSEEDMIVVTPKFDGLSLLHNETSGMTYSRGGCENEGQDCTAHYRAANIVSRPSEFAFTYGEFVFNKASWEANFAGKMSPDTGEKYKSPRNTAAGLLNRDQPSENLKYVDFFRYGTDEESLSKFNSYVNLYTSLCNKFDQQFLYDMIRVKDLTEKDLISAFNRFNKEYYIDGLVLYANDFNVWKRVGRHQTTGNPNYAIAYKNPIFTETFTTTVRDVTWKVSKAGALKPVVNIDTVDTGDCEMENPTGYNAKYISENDIATGAKIKVTRSGGVIPKILQVIEPADVETLDDMWDELCECPVCGAPTAWNSSMVELCCTNKNCKGVRLAKIVFFYTTVGAENMGEETIAKMFDAGYDTLSRMLNITFDDLIDIDGFGESIANTILENNRKIKEGVEITTLMHASDCFTGIGKTKAKKILEDMSLSERNAFQTGMISVITDQFGPETAAFKKLSLTMQSFYKGVEPFYQFIAQNGLTVIPMQEKLEPVGTRFSGMKVCFTGVRDINLEVDIEAGGGEVCSGVTKKTTHLIVADMSSTSSKMVKAQTLGIPIFTLEDFKAKF